MLVVGTRWPGPILLSSVVGSTCCCCLPSRRWPRVVSRLREIILCLSSNCIEVGCSSSCSHLLFRLRFSQCLFVLKFGMGDDSRSRVWSWKWSSHGRRGLRHPIISNLSLEQDPGFHGSRILLFRSWCSCLGASCGDGSAATWAEILLFAAILVLKLLGSSLFHPCCSRFDGHMEHIFILCYATEAWMGRSWWENQLGVVLDVCVHSSTNCAICALNKIVAMFVTILVFMGSAVMTLTSGCIIWRLRWSQLFRHNFLEESIRGRILEMIAAACSALLLLLLMNAWHFSIASVARRLELGLTLVWMVCGVLLVMILVIIVPPLLAGVTWPPASALKSGGRLMIVVYHVAILILIDVLHSECLRATSVPDMPLRTRVHRRLFGGYNWGLWLRDHWLRVGLIFGRDELNLRLFKVALARCLFE